MLPDDEQRRPDPEMKEDQPIEEEKLPEEARIDDRRLELRHPKAEGTKEKGLNRNMEVEPDPPPRHPTQETPPNQ